ncbi:MULTISPECIES: hypothetical protein [Pseudomonas]|uniref:Uncharacterized protein n=1 Tax=Pseudomonas frederiksbergensis TaxID=104087 RepID=A0A2S8H3N7_9PSED|nr:MULTISPECIES: hypothetical protein [Pseudomonas]MDR8364193.1 hypothetical protein [Pseudomonas sp. JL3]PQO96405.1 hypothetical protein C5612_30395 [Pseudomonas frederiksbergensis]WLG92440.1 hypothetical protein PSH72_10295 [Pseudomonas cucumis]
MVVKLKRSDLQTDKHKYTWSRDEGDSAYTGALDRQQVDKDEGYEVLYFLEKLLNKHDKSKVADLHAAENAFHTKELSQITDRATLISRIEKILSW